ncbi:N-acetylmuramoyl-L-alanine amidase [Roseimicrobium gellanilyticum]|uniref:N-acetylmuramoyl-L-alanine amidase n=2 Tax=Roseimicrobium gellanilyticum TaxID=748857 RepID=A0A366H8Q6_9BACT|nr:N-acetylmuramoyl-L-alanine amidase [Roseimicrobium gellanilyticum]
MLVTHGCFMTSLDMHIHTMSGKCRGLLCAFALVLLLATRSFAAVVVIDAGHGGSDRGTRWNGLSEKNLTLDVAKRVETILKRNGVTTVMTRRTDRAVALESRAAIANRYRNSLFVSIHFNSTRLTAIKGIETYYRSDRGRKVAYTIQQSLISKVSANNRGIKRGNYAVLKHTRGTAVLVECGFISNKAEASRCGSAAHRQKLAEAIARGILRSR